MIYFCRLNLDYQKEVTFLSGSCIKLNIIMKYTCKIVVSLPIVKFNTNGIFRTQA